MEPHRPLTKPFAEFGEHREDILAMAFNQDGRTLATAGLDGIVKLWDITNRANPVELIALDRHAGFVNSVAFSPDGDLLAIGNENATATLLDVENPRKPREMSDLAAHLKDIADVAFSPDGNILATGSYDNSALLWDISDPGHAIPLAVPLAGEADKVSSVAFHPDGHTLATSSHGHAVRLWETDINLAATKVCELALSVITREEWDRYLPRREYLPPCSQPAKEHDSGEDVRTLGYTLLLAKSSNKCVAVKGGVAVIGARVYQFTCARASAPEWDLRRTAANPTPDGNPIYLIRNVSTGMCLDSRLSEKRVGGASVVVQRPCADDAVSQHWRFDARGQQAESTEGQFVHIEDNDDCLDINNNAMTDGAYVIRWQCGNSPNQVFRVSTEALDR